MVNRTAPPVPSNRARSVSMRHGPSRPETTMSKRRRWTVAEFCAEWDISKRTFHEWRAKGRAPDCIKIPNGELRIEQTDYDVWVQKCRENAR